MRCRKVFVVDCSRSGAYGCGDSFTEQHWIYREHEELCFHLETCRHVPELKNRLNFDFREEAIDRGYRPCQKCKP